MLIGTALAGWRRALRLERQGIVGLGSGSASAWQQAGAGQGVAHSLKQKDDALGEQSLPRMMCQPPGQVGEQGLMYDFPHSPHHG